MKTNNTAASLHALCVAANDVIADLEFLDSDAVSDRLREDIDNCIERLENIDEAACDYIKAGRPDFKFVRLARGCKEMLREFLGMLEDIARHDDSDVESSIEECWDTINSLEDEDYAGAEDDRQQASREMESIDTDIDFIYDFVVPRFVELPLA